MIAIAPQEFVYEGTISEDQAGASGMNTIAFNLSVLPEANTYYFDDIKCNTSVNFYRKIKS